MDKKILVVIPARGGSKGIPRKNVRLMAGKPLISYAITCALNSRFKPTVTISSDDEEILTIGEKYGAIRIERPAYLGEDHVTMDPVIYHATCYMEEKEKITYDYIITMQPTSPMLSVETLDSAIEEAIKGDFDTLLSAVNDPHLSWRRENGKCIPNYKERLNRQYLPEEMRETGAFFISKRSAVKENTRFGENVSVFPMPDHEAGDIDTVEDWVIAEMNLCRKNILIRLEGYPEIGTGHIFRGILLAQNLMEHNVLFAISEKSKLAMEKIEASHYKYISIKTNDEVPNIVKENQIDIVINDILDTEEAYIKSLKEAGVRVINFEDRGPGSFMADATINALYEKPYDDNYDKKNFYWGSKYYLIREEFIINEPKEFDDELKEVIVSFGGTDPSNLTKKTVSELLEASKESKFHTTVVLGLGYDKEGEIRSLIEGYEDKFEIIKNVSFMSELMRKADLAISSQGRTMLELATMGVPTIILSQNEREKSHAFGNINNGFLNLGLGSEAKPGTIAKTVVWLSKATEIRKNMREQMLKKDLRHGIGRVKDLIIGD